MTMDTETRKKYEAIAEHLLDIRSAVSSHLIANIDELRENNELQNWIKLRDQLRVMRDQVMQAIAKDMAQAIKTTAANLNGVVVKIKQSVHNIQKVQTAMDMLTQGVDLLENVLRTDPAAVLDSMAGLKATFEELTT